MNFTKDDLRKLQFPIAFFIASIILGWLIYSTANTREHKATEALQKQTVELQLAREHYQSSGKEKENIEKYMPLYSVLIERGFIGEEQRIDWISDLRKINQENKLFGVNYDINAQEEYKPKFPTNTGKFTLRRSVMELKFAMLHENDLFTLFEALRLQKNPPFMVRDCIVSRTKAELRGIFEPNLNTVCEIDWLTITEPKTK